MKVRVLPNLRMRDVEASGRFHERLIGWTGRFDPGRPVLLTHARLPVS